MACALDILYHLGISIRSAENMSGPIGLHGIASATSLTCSEKSPKGTLSEVYDFPTLGHWAPGMTEKEAYAKNVAHSWIVDMPLRI